jgi:hypothetical protein
VLERAKGIEPSYAAWEAAVLPLNYARKPLKLLSIPNPLARFPLSNPCQLNPWRGSYIAILMPANTLQEHDQGEVVACYPSAKRGHLIAN